MIKQQQLIKFIFTVRAKNGVTVNNLQILSSDQTAAEKQLFQMYHQCTILEVKQQPADSTKHADHPRTFEAVLDLIASD